MYSTIFLRQGNNTAQVFCDGVGWGRAFPIKKEKEAHESLSLLFHRDVVPNVMVMDGVKAQVQGEFRRKYMTMDVTSGKLNPTLNHPIWVKDECVS
jgi:hypothetical protein